MTKEIILSEIAEETKSEIKSSPVNPVGYNTEEYRSAYLQVFGDNDANESEIEEFNSVISDMWTYGNI